MKTLLQVLLGILELQATWVSSQKLEQSPQFLNIQFIPEGKNFTINCNSSKTVYAFHWYRQKKYSEGPISLLITLWKSGEEKSHEKMMVKLDEEKQQSVLHITAPSTSHSGTYFCGVHAQ